MDNAQENIHSNTGAAKITGIQNEFPSKPSLAPNSQVGSNVCKALAKYQEETPRNDMLPNEMLLEIFSYLGEEDLLSSRRVCRSWNSSIVNWGKFTKTMSFNVRRGLSSNSYAVLNSSTVAWKKVELQNCITSNYPSWNFPTILIESLTTLTLRKCVITWASMMDIASRFQSLEKLILVNCKMELVSRVRWIRSGHKEAAIRSRNAQVVPSADAPQRGIFLKLDMEDYRNLNFCLRQFTRNCHNSPFVLKGLEISVPVPECEYLEDFGITLLSLEGTELLQEFSRSLQNLLISCGGTNWRVII